LLIKKEWGELIEPLDQMSIDSISPHSLNKVTKDQIEYQFIPNNLVKKTILLIKKATKNGAEICLLPENFIPGYALNLNIFKYAESINDKTINTLIKLSKHLNVYISGSFTERTDKDFFNTMFLIGPEGLLGFYRKIFVYGLEQLYWKPGNKGKIIETNFGKVGLGICADMHFPTLWKYYAGKVDLILICSAWLEYPSYIRLTYTNYENKLLKILPVKISKALQVPVAFCNASHSFLKVPIVGNLYCAGYSKIIQNGKVCVSIDSRAEKNYTS